VQLVAAAGAFAVLMSGYTVESFDWNNYQKLTKFIAAPKSLFSNTQVAVSRVDILSCG